MANALKGKLCSEWTAAFTAVRPDIMEDNDDPNKRHKNEMDCKYLNGPNKVFGWYLASPGDNERWVKACYNRNDWDLKEKILVHTLGGAVSNGICEDSKSVYGIYVIPGGSFWIKGIQFDRSG